MNNAQVWKHLAEVVVVRINSNFALFSIYSSFLCHELDDIFFLPTSMDAKKVYIVCLLPSWVISCAVSHVAKWNTGRYDVKYNEVD